MENNNNIIYLLNRCSITIHDIKHQWSKQDRIMNPRIKSWKSFNHYFDLHFYSLIIFPALMYACIFGNMVAIIQRLYSKAANFHQHMSTTKEFLKFYKISEELRNTINNYVRREWSASQGVDVEAVSKLLGRN